MQHSIVELVKGVHVPWGTDRRKLAKTVTDYADCDSFAAGILNVTGPQADELLALHGWTSGAVTKWLTTAAKDKMIATAIKDGIAVAYPGQRNGEAGLQKGGNCVVVVVSESISENRWWWFAAGRNGNKAFSLPERNRFHNHYRTIPSAQPRLDHQRYNRSTDILRSLTMPRNPYERLVSVALRCSLLFAAFIAFASPVQANDADARQVFDSLFAAKIKTVGTTPDRVDDVALAKEMVEIARKSKEHPALITLLCGAALDLTSKHADGLGTAVEAMQLLAESVPDAQASARDKLIPLLTRQMAAGKPDEREQAGETLIDLLLTIGDEKIERKQYADAAVDYRRAMTVAQQRKSASVNAAKAKLEYAAGCERALKQIERLQEKLLSNAKDHASAEEIVKMYVLDLDSPDQAATFLDRVIDEGLKSLIPLAIKPIADIDAKNALALANWYVHQARAMGVPSNLRPWKRAEAYLTRHLKLTNEQDLSYTQASTLLKEVRGKLEALDDNSRYITNSIGIKLVRIAEGNFLMGEKGASRKTAIDKPFYFGITEVTQAHWKAVMRSTPWKSGEFVKEGDTYPAIYVGWKGANEFCETLSRKERKRYRLPTEAEWEYACRAGSSGSWSFSNDVNDLDRYAWHRGNTELKGEKYPHQVATRLPNAWGLYDLHGNVWEWCADEFSAGRRVIRGGAWSFDGVPWSQSGYRASHPVDSPNYYVGFRIVLDIP